MKTIRIPSPEALPTATTTFIAAMGDHRIFAFRGAMGAGKTTFIQAVCRALGVTDVVNSPTFALVNEYRSDTTGEIIYHFDFYRIASLREAYEIGVDEYWSSGRLCFIEWPENVEEILPPDTVFLTIEELSNGVRHIYSV